MATNFLEEEQNRLRSAPKTDWQRQTAASVGEAWEGFKRGLTPNRTPKHLQDGAKMSTGLGIGGLKPSHARGAAVLGAAPQQPPASSEPAAAARENLTGTAPPVSTPAYPVAEQPSSDQTNMITAGTQGQDGYGMAKRRLSDGSGAIGTNRMGTGQVGGYSFRGTGADFAKFAQQPTRPAIQDGNTVASQQAAYLGVRDRHEASKAAQANLAGLDPRSGWGWKGRRELYMAQQGLDQRDREMGTRAMMDAARMQQDQQQAAATLAQDQRQFEAGQQGRDVDVQAKQAELGFNRQKQAVLDRLNATEDPEERRVLTGQLLAMQGKDPAQKYQVVTREGFDPVTNMPTKTPYAVNQDDPTQSFEIRGQGGQQQFAPMPREKKALVKGQAYDTPRGPATWNGSMFIPL